MVFFLPFHFLKFVPHVELRERLESRQDRDFRRETQDDKRDAFSCVRVGGTAFFSGDLKLDLMAQFAEDDAHPRPTGAFRYVRKDVRSANLLYAKKDLKVTFGRQLIAEANQRLLGVYTFGNIGLSWDALRVQKGPWDIWAGQLGLANFRANGIKLAYASYTSHLGQSQLIYKHDNPPTTGDVDTETLHHWYRRPYKGIIIDTDAAYQVGHANTTRVEAWMAHLRIERKVNPLTNLYVETSSASGGGNANVIRGFDSLYPDEHADFGTVDIQTLRNMNELVFGMVWTPTKKWNVRTKAHFISLRDDTDAWYGPLSTPNKLGTKVYQDPTGAAGRDVGKEFDIDVTYFADKRTTLTTGLGIFDPGHFVNTVGGVNHNQVWMYAMAGYRF